MGLKGAIRTFEAASRRAARAAERNRRAAQKHEEQLQKLALLEDAREAVEKWNQYLVDVASIHKSVPAEIDWSQISMALDPDPPQRSTEREEVARKALNSYHPGFLSRLLGISSKRLALLEKEVRVGREADERSFLEAQARHAEEVREVSEMRELASRILANDQIAWAKFLKEHSGIEEIPFMGRRFEAEFTKRRASVKLFANGRSIVPTQRMSLLKSGKISQRDMPKAEYWRLYQDHVCSASIRMGSEVFCSLPVDEVEVTAFESVLDQACGRHSEIRILSVVFPRESFSSLNLPLTDASDCVERFSHVMEFSATSGFSAT